MGIQEQINIMEYQQTVASNVVTNQGFITLPKTLSDKIVSHLNDALADEYSAHYFYVYAANWCESVTYLNAAKFFRNEADAELKHAEIIQKYLTNWNAVPKLPSIKFDGDFKNLIDIVNKAYVLEFNLGEKYNKMSAEIFNDHLMTFDFLQQFRTKQYESITEYSDLLNAAQLIDVTSKLDLLHYEEQYFGG